MSDKENKYMIEGIDKLKSLVKDITMCLFCTNIENNDGSTTRPMSAVHVCDQGNIWFFDQIFDPSSHTATRLLKSLE